MPRAAPDSPAGLSPRLRLQPPSSSQTLLDGGWWPRTTDASVELPALINALTGSGGAITHLLLHADDWDLPHPRRITIGGRTVRLGWFTAQPAGLLTAIRDYDRDRIDLLVVPPRATASAAGAALAAAADGHNARQVPVLLAAIDLGV